MTATAVASAALPAANFGGRYSYTANADGTFNFHNLPIVGELAKGARPDYPELAIDREWLEQALAALSAAAKDEYLPPLNVNHHGQEKPVERIGFVRAREVRKIRYRGAEMYALFADLERVGLAAALEIAKGNLPYCSIEGPVKGPGDVKSLAMLTDKPPQFGFPIITAGLPLSAEGGEPWSLGASTYRVFSFAYEGDEEKPKDEDGGTEPDADGVKNEAEEEAEIKKGGGGDAVAKTLAELLLHVRKLCAVLLPAEEDRQNLDPETGTRGPVGTQKSDEPDKKEQETNMAADQKTEAQLAALSSDLDALKKKDAEREAEATAANLAAEAVKSLEGEGFHLSAEAKASFGKYAKQGKATLDGFVADYKSFATKDPPRDLATALASGQKVAALGTEDETLVAKFAGADANAGEIARVAIRKYPAYAASAPRPMTKERWIEMALANHKSGEFAMVSADEFEKDDS